MLSELEREMLEALNPFADAVKTYGDICKDIPDDVLWKNGVSWGDLRRARRLVAKAEAKERETAQQAHERMLALRLAECPDDVEFYR